MPVSVAMAFELREIQIPDGIGSAHAAPDKVEPDAGRPLKPD
jgi:hypothetical protein